jgi:DNA-binding NarL/FixJ family response regulator
MNSTTGRSLSFLWQAVEGEDTNNNNHDDHDHDEDDEESIKFRQRNRHWVVLVDDEESIRLAVGQYLYDKGYQVTACADAESLLQVLSSSNDVDEDIDDDGAGPSSSSSSSTTTTKTKRRLPDGIISDIRMPGSTKNGYDLVTEIRADPTWDGIPILLLTAKAMTQDRIKGYQAGADAFLPKPFDPDELVSLLDNLIGRSQQRSEGTQRPTVNVVNVVNNTHNHNHSSSPSQSSSPSLDDLRDLQRQLDEIKDIVRQNVAGTVLKTDVDLTDPERQVLLRVCDGRTTSQVASDLHLSVGTVNGIVQRLYRRTGTNSRTELVKWAVQVGYVPSS